MTRRPRLPPKDPEPEIAPIPVEQRIFAERLIAARKAAGLTQVQLAEISGIGQPHISHLEKATWEPRLITIVALCRALGIPSTDLLPNDDQTPKS